MEGTKGDIIGNSVEEDGCIIETEKVDEEIEDEVFTTETREIRVSRRKPQDRHDTCYLSFSETPEINENDEKVGEKERNDEERNDEDNEPEINEKEKESIEKESTKKR